MSPQSTAKRPLTIYQPPGSAESWPRDTATPSSALSHPELTQRAGQNRRRHEVRVAGRLAGLVALDLAAFLLLRSALHVMRAGWVSLSWLQPLVDRVMYEGFLGGWRFFVALLVSLIATGNYGAGDRRRNVGRILLASTVATSLVLWASLWQNPIGLTLLQFCSTVALTTASVALTRLGGDHLLRRTPLTRGASLRTILVGAPSPCTRMWARLEGGHGGLEVVGYVDSRDSVEDPEYSRAPLGGLAELAKLIHEHGVDTVLLCGHLDDSALARVVNAAVPVECRVLTGARTLSLAGVKPTVCWRGGEPFIELRHVELRVSQMLLKRLLDIVISGAALVCLLPVLFGVTLAIRLNSRGPIVFRQRRLGRNGRVFDCLKFRSMHIDAEQRLRSDAQLLTLYEQNDFKLPEHLDPRVTRVGRILRRTSLDELPQFWNVLVGDMSLVGPRPIVPDEIRHYNDSSSMFLSLKPGLTGAWQVSGRSTLGYPARAVVELEYVESWSIGRDLMILLRTLPTVLFQRGAH